MLLTQQQIEIIQTTFAQVPDADALASRFYDRLFEIDPTTKPMFRGDMAEQRKKLMQTLAVVVNNVDNLESLIPAIESLGQRHVDYGVTIQHWDSVGAALLWTLADAFGTAYTEEVNLAWSTAYAVIAQTAIAAAYPLVKE